jgi:hypothetical protein
LSRWPSGLPLKVFLYLVIPLTQSKADQPDHASKTLRGLRPAVDHVTVYGDKQLVFRFRCGLEITKRL